jgi:cellulose synthase/poly-beta-1,6-N-acetylglucosamine synthase-like glycosyltransferase
MAEILSFLKLLAGIDYLYVTLLIFLSITFIQLLYHFLFYFPLLFKRKKHPEPESWPDLSVVICARNEARNLRRYLPSILEQEYPRYEVIVVNDCSEDDTEVVLNRFSEKYEHLRTTFLREDLKFPHGKKLALTVGIKAAQYEHVVLTDADCFAVSKQWLKEMASGFTEKKSIVLGYGGYNEVKGILNRIIRFDTMWIALQYLSFAKLRIPYMGVGRNLAYRKSLFFENKGFASHAKIDSGDDDLFINQVATGKNTAIMLDTDSHTRSRPKLRFKNWVEQKRRHLTSSSFYKPGHKMLLFFEPFSRVSFYLLLIPLLISPLYREITLCVLGLRLMMFMTTIILCRKRFNERKLILMPILLDIFMPIFYFYCMLLNKISPYKRWR